MPCDTSLREGQTLALRNEEIKRALAKLETELNLGRVGVKISANGAVAFTGRTSEDYRDVSDVCAIRTLTSQGSFALRQAIQRAEAQQGRKMNPHAVAAGHHSHDGGKTFGPGHK